MCNKGFTLLEMLIELSIFSILLLLFSFTKGNGTLSVDVRRYAAKIEALQLNSILHHESNEIKLKRNEICFNDECESFPTGRSGDEGLIRFNQAGNVNQANTYCFYQGVHEQCLIIQLGGGRMRLE